MVHFSHIIILYIIFNCENSAVEFYNAVSCRIRSVDLVHYFFDTLFNRFSCLLFHLVFIVLIRSAIDIIYKSFATFDIFAFSHFSVYSILCLRSHILCISEWCVTECHIIVSIIWQAGLRWALKTGYIANITIQFRTFTVIITIILLRIQKWCVQTFRNSARRQQRAKREKEKEKNRKRQFYR